MGNKPHPSAALSRSNKTQNVTMSWFSPSVSLVLSALTLTSYIKMWFGLCVFMHDCIFKNIWWHFAYPLWMSVALRWARLTNGATHWTHQPVPEFLLTTVTATHPSYTPTGSPAFILSIIITVMGHRSPPPNSSSWTWPYWQWSIC